MFRDSEKQLKSSLRDQEMVDTYLYLAKVYVRLDQPLTAIEILKKVAKISKSCFFRSEKTSTGLEISHFTVFQGIEKFIGETALLTGIARIHEVLSKIYRKMKTNIALKCVNLSYYTLKALNNMSDAVQVYTDVLRYDNTHVEAIACIATQHFYTDQPEIALRYFR